MRELEHLLPELEPPRGGFARLQERVHRPGVQRRPALPAWRWFAVAALPALALALLLPHLTGRPDHDAELTRTLRQDLNPRLPANGVQVVDGVALQLPSGQANVHLYLVQTRMPTHQTPNATGKPR